MENEAKFWGNMTKIYCLLHNGLMIHWNFATIYSRLRHSFTYRDTHISKLVTLKMQVQVKMYNIRSDAIRWKIHDSYLIAIVMIALSFPVCEIVAKQEKYQNDDLENEGQEVEERDLRISIGNVRIHIADICFRILATWEYTFTQNVTHTTRDTHTHTNIETGVMNTCQICKADLSKNVSLNS